MQAKLNTLLELQDHIAAFSALLSGEFKTEIEALKVLNKEQTKIASLLDTKNKLDAYRAEADKYYQVKKEEADYLMLNVNARAGELETLTQTLESDRKAIARETEAVAEAQRVLKRTANDAEKYQAEQERLLVAAKEALQERLDALDTREAHIEAREASIKSKMDAFKALAK